jgi:hypothetical protein
MTSGVTKLKTDCGVKFTPETLETVLPLKLPTLNMDVAVRALPAGNAVRCVAAAPAVRLADGENVLPDGVTLTGALAE